MALPESQHAGARAARRSPFPPDPAREDFDGSDAADRLSVAAIAMARGVVQPDGAPGYLRLYGRETIGSQFRQSLVARRQQAHCYSAVDGHGVRARALSADRPASSATTTARSSTTCTSRTTQHVGKHLRVMTCMPDGVQSDVFTPPIAIPSGTPVQLRVEVDFERLHFAYRVEGDGVALAAAAVRREHPVGRSDGAGQAELHRRVRRHGLPGPRRAPQRQPTSTTSSTGNADFRAGHPADL